MAINSNHNYVFNIIFKFAIKNIFKPIKHHPIFKQIMLSYCFYFIIIKVLTRKQQILLLFTNIDNSNNYLKQEVH